MNQFRLLLPLFLMFPVAPAPSQVSRTDDAGRTVTLEHHAVRVVSLAPSITETMFAVGAGDRLVGVTDFCNYPPEAEAITRIGGMINPNIEAVTALNPDLILVSMEGNARDSFERFEHLHATLFVTNPRALGGIYKSIEDLAFLCGTEKEGASLLANLKEREESVRKGVPARLVTVMMLVSVRPLILVGSGTFLSEILSVAGGDNIAGASGQTYPTFSREAVISADPSVIVLTEGLIREPEDLLVEYPEWERLTAVREGRVYSIDADIASRPGPRAIDALEELSRMLKRQATGRTSGRK